MFDLWRLRKSSRDMGPSGAPMPKPFNLLFSETNSSMHSWKIEGQQERKRHKKIKQMYFSINYKSIYQFLNYKCEVNFKRQNL